MLRAAERRLRQATYEAMSVVAVYPRLALPAARWGGHGELLDRDTDMLIEGYPRSGNSFAVAAFRLAQPRPVRVAHHVHAPAHVVAATRAGIPALVVIRRPHEAVTEFVATKPSISVGQALRGYVRFYAPLLRVQGGFVVGEYREVTSDFGAVIERINRRFGTSFLRFEHTQENLRACLEAMDRYWKGREGPGLPFIGRTPAGGARSGGERSGGERPNEDADGADRGPHPIPDSPSRVEAERLYRTLALGEA